MSLHRSLPDPARGVFETLLVRDGRPLELEAHLARLTASVTDLYAEPLPDALDELVSDRARGVRLGRLRLTLAPNGASALACDVRVSPVEDELVFPGFSRAVHLGRLVIPGGLGAHKWADRRLVEQAEADDSLPLVLDGDGSVLEASRANVFVVEGASIVTPPADGRILPGVTRRRVVALVPVREETVSFERLLAADEVFLSGSVRGIEPVHACDGGRAWRKPMHTPRVSDELRRCWERNP